MSKYEISFYEALKMLQKWYGAECLLKLQVFKWYKSFGQDRKAVEDDPLSGRPLI